MQLIRSKYVAKDSWIMPAICIPLTIILNSIYFGHLYFSSSTFFFGAGLVTFIELTLNFFLCGIIAVLLLERFPREIEVFKKLTFMIVSFILVSTLLKYLLFKLYEVLPPFKIELNENRLAWVCLSVAIANIFLTFLMEGIYRYEAWQKSVKESELLNINYRQTQLNALKSHISPHFLFNNLNTLSSLIEDDEETSELFLNEMTKVYRYMLKNDTGQLVSLESELKFLQSYLFLLGKRYGDGLQVLITTNEPCAEKQIVPMLLQVIIENAINQNVVSKSKPLHISVFVDGNCFVVVENKLQPKIIAAEMEVERGLDTMVRKYKLIGKQLNVIDEPGFRRVVIELINENEG